jgi:hypothetical protein
VKIILASFAKFVPFCLLATFECKDAFWHIRSWHIQRRYMLYYPMGKHIIYAKSGKELEQCLAREALEGIFTVVQKEIWGKVLHTMWGLERKRA